MRLLPTYDSWKGTIISKPSVRIAYNAYQPLHYNSHHWETGIGVPSPINITQNMCIYLRVRVQWSRKNTATFKVYRSYFSCMKLVIFFTLKQPFHIPSTLHSYTVDAVFTLSYWYQDMPVLRFCLTGKVHNYRKLRDRDNFDNLLKPHPTPLLWTGRWNMY